MKEIITGAKYHLQRGEVIEISDNLWQVGDELENQIVREIKKPGRTFLTCSCKHDAMFNSESPLCSHKLAIIGFLITKDWQIKLNKTIKKFESFEKINEKLEPYYVIEDLKLLRGLW